MTNDITRYTKAKLRSSVGKTTDYYSQAGALYRLVPAAEKDRLTTNIAKAMHGIPRHIIDRQLQHFAKADADYGRRVAEKLKTLSER